MCTADSSPGHLLRVLLNMNEGSARADGKEERKEDHWQILFPRWRTVQWQILSKMEVSKIQRSILPIVVFLSPLPSPGLSCTLQDTTDDWERIFAGDTGILLLVCE